MTKQQLNRDIKRLKAAVNIMKDETIESFFPFVQDVVKPEFRRLYNADNTMKSLNADSIRTMLRLNVRFRIIEFHQFGIHIAD